MIPRLALAVMLVTATGGSALAQSKPNAPTVASGHREPTAAERDEAERRYRRALDLFDDGSFDAAYQELRRAYDPPVGGAHLS